MRKIRVSYFGALCALFVFASCAERAASQAVEANIPAQGNPAPAAERPESNFPAEIADLNGTWVSEWSYNALMGMAEEERERYISRLGFSWGEGKRLVHSDTVLYWTGRNTLSTFIIDTTAERPFVNAGMMGAFIVTDVAQAGASAIRVNAFRGPITWLDTPERGRIWTPEFTFHFIDKDTLWIDSDSVSMMSEEAERGVLWRRLSGPGQNDAVSAPEIAESNFAVEINDLNGTWLTEGSAGVLEMTEEEKEAAGLRTFRGIQFSWGEGINISNMALLVDITAENPEILSFFSGGFNVTDIAQLGINTLKVKTYNPQYTDVDGIVELIFHFVDRDTFWIESYQLGFEFERGALWRRLSGPA